METVTINLKKSGGSIEVSRGKEIWDMGGRSSPRSYIFEYKGVSVEIIPDHWELNERQIWKVFIDGIGTDIIVRREADCSKGWYSHHVFDTTNYGMSRNMAAAVCDHLDQFNWDDPR